MFRIASIVVFLALHAAVACTRVGSQASTENRAKTGTPQIGDDRALPGYLAMTPDEFYYAGFYDADFGGRFPKTDLGYVVSSPDLGGADPFSESILLTVLDANDSQPGPEATDILVELCALAEDVIAAGNAGAIFHNEKLYVPASLVRDTADASCFARLLSAFLGDTLAFVQSPEDATPVAFARTVASAEVDSLMVEWVDGETIAVNFDVPAEAASLRHAIALSYDAQPPHTCGGGVNSQLIAAGVSGTTFADLDGSQAVWFRVCSINEDGVASPGIPWRLAADAEASTSTSTSSSSSSTTSSSSGGGLTCPSGGVTLDGDEENCYFLGGLNQNCYDACSGYSMNASNATIDLIGQGSGDNWMRCQEVAMQLLTGVSYQQGMDPTGLGCHHHPDTMIVFWQSSGAGTTLNASLLGMRRICACN